MKTFFLIFTFLSLSSYQNHVYAQILPSDIRQQTFCNSSNECNEGFFFPFFQCNNGVCEVPEHSSVELFGTPAPSDESEAESSPAPSLGEVGSECVSIRECIPGLVCVSGNPRGICEKPDGMIGLSHLLTNLIQEDYSPSSENDTLSSNILSQPGPLLTSRALAIIYLAGHDTYAMITGAFKPILQTTGFCGTFYSEYSDIKQLESDKLESHANFATQAAILEAAKLLYPNSADSIIPIQNTIGACAAPSFIKFGEFIATRWLESRKDDGSDVNLLDKEFEIGKLLRHQPDPNFPIVQNTSETQMNFGRKWGKVKPFMLSDIRKQAFLGPFPDVTSRKYRENLREVTKVGKCNKKNLTNSNGILLQDIGTFWGYDGAIDIGVPPRLYLQTILAVKELQDLPFKHQLRALTAVAVAMADAGIAAWYWKFEYDLWRPVIGIRNDIKEPVSHWNPVGIALSNVVSEGAPVSDRPPQCVGLNPNFPAYPSGHASFGTAAFKTLARLLSKKTRDISVLITSDEFNGRTVDGTTGERRRVFTQNLTLEQAIEQNKDSRVFLGVHWRFDSEAGDTVGTRISQLVFNEFWFPSD